MASSEKPVVFDNWEDLDESGAKEHVERIQVNRSVNGEISSSQGSSEAQAVIPEELRVKCSMPPTPIVTILKRPSPRQNSSMGGGDGFLVNGDGTKPRVPLKTLQQREEEYAQARLRILGEAQSPDEDLPSQEEEKVCRILLNKLEVGKPNTISRFNDKDSETDDGQSSVDNSTIDHWNSDCASSSHKVFNNLSNPNVTFSSSPNSGATSLSNCYIVNNSVIQSRNEESSQSIRNSESNIIRQPRGPDDTNGFSLRR